MRCQVQLDGRAECPGENVVLVRSIVGTTIWVCDGHRLEEDEVLQEADQSAGPAEVRCPGCDVDPMAPHNGEGECGRSRPRQPLSPITPAEVTAAFRKVEALAVLAGLPDAADDRERR